MPIVKRLGQNLLPNVNDPEGSHNIANFIMIYKEGDLKKDLVLGLH
jgi:hypothetical protein